MILKSMKSDDLVNGNFVWGLGIRDWELGN
jgi:hypothetical protein